MNIYLNDLETKQSVKLDLAAEYALPCQDLFVIFYSLGERCSLFNGEESRPYDNYFFKKVNHIIGATANYQGHNYSLTIGFYIDNNQVVPFLIDHRGSNDYPKFETSFIINEHHYSNFQLVNYKEYVDLSAMLGFENLSFKDFLTRLLKGEIEKHNYTLYNVFPKEQQNFSDFLTYKGFGVFLDEEEKRTSNI